MTSRNSSSRLAAVSAVWADKPVTLPPGRARFATRPSPTGSRPSAKTIGITDVASFNAGTASANVKMASTFNRANSTAISARRAERPSVHRYCIAMVRPSIQPSCPNRWTKSVVLDPQAEESAPKNPMVGSLSDCCARAASGHAAAAPTSVMNSRRLTGPSGRRTVPYHAEGRFVHHSRFGLPAPR